MEKHIPSLETRFYDLAGTSSLNFKENIDLNQFAKDLTDIDTNTYKPVTVKVYVEDETIITLYAAKHEDISRYQNTIHKIPVKKFKVTVENEKLFKYIKQLQLTLVIDDIDVENFEVKN